MLDLFLRMRRATTTRLNADGDAEMIIIGVVLLAIGTSLLR